MTNFCDNPIFKLAIVGCGVIGERRAMNLPAHSTVVGCVDIDIIRANRVAEITNSKVYSSIQELLAHEKIDGCIIATSNHAIASAAQQFLDAGVNLLIEKPAARSVRELRRLHNPKNCVIKIGFNHRFHPAYTDLLNELNSHPDDPIMFISARYGNGARLGFDQEWRSKVELSGGGELLDQGVHVIDLAANILPALRVKTAWVRTHFWNMPVDDNAWAILSTPEGQTFTMHVSSCEWKNEFLFEVYTRSRKYVWSGLGRSYGPEKLILYTMKPEMGPPEVSVKEYISEDLSWKLENTNFIQSCRLQAEVFGGYGDAVRVLGLVDDIYEYSLKLEHDSKHPEWLKIE